MTRAELGIPVLFDAVCQGFVASETVLSAEDIDVSLLRSRVRKERKSGATRFRCGLCRDPVYVSNSGGSSHFAHYHDSGPSCAWRADAARSLDSISGGRFRGNQEGDLHRRTLLTLQMLCRQCEGFRDVGIPNATLFGIADTGHRFPDLAATYEERRVVFELQISKTYLPVVTDRELFYRRNKIFLFWLFHNFEAHRVRQTERDILALRNRQAFELDSEAIKKSLEDRRLTFRAHWCEPRCVDGDIAWEWKSRLIGIDELKFDDLAIDALFVDPWQEEARILRGLRLDTLRKFEEFWFDRKRWAEKLSKRFLEKLKAGEGRDYQNSFSEVAHRAFAAALKSVGADPGHAERVFELNFDRILDRIFFLRDGVNRFNSQTLHGAIDSVLENWPQHAEVLCAVVVGCDKANLLATASVRPKLLRILGGAGAAPVPQCHDFDRLIAALCPGAARWLRLPVWTFDPLISDAA